MKFVYNDPRTAQYVARSVGSTDCQCHSSIGLEHEGQIVAGGVFDNYSGPNIFLHFSTSLPVLPRDLMRLLFGYAFDGLKVKRVTGAFSAANQPVKRLAKLVGFQFEAKLKGIYRDGSDMLLFWCDREHCRFLPELKEAA